MTQNKRKTGARYERIAGEYLEAQGYRIVTYNYRCRKGEIDIIAEDGEYLVFCEVKYRRGGKGRALEAVDIKKQRILSQCALYYLMELGRENIPCRFDVIGVEGEEITLIKDAFTWAG